MLVLLDLCLGRVRSQRAALLAWVIVPACGLVVQGAVPREEPAAACAERVPGISWHRAQR